MLSAFAADGGLSEAGRQRHEKRETVQHAEVCGQLSDRLSSTAGGILTVCAWPYATDVVIVPVYVPATAAVGMATFTAGFHEALVMCPFPALDVNAVTDELNDCAAAAVGWPGVRVAVPLDAVVGPDQ